MEFIHPQPDLSKKKFYTVFLFTVLTGAMISFYPINQISQNNSQSDEEPNNEFWNDPHQDQQDKSSLFEKTKQIGLAVVTIHGAYQFVKEIFEINTNLSNWKPLTGFFDIPSDTVIPNPLDSDNTSDDFIPNNSSADSTSPIIKVPLAAYGYILDDGNDALRNSNVDLSTSIMLGNVCLAQFESESHVDSLNCYLNLLKNDADNPILLNNIGIQLVILNNPTEALNYFNQAYQIESDYENYQVLHNLAVTNTILGNEKLSQKYYQLAVKENHPFFSEDLESFFNDVEKIKNNNIDFDYSLESIQQS